MNDVRITYSLGGYRNAVESALENMRNANFIKRILAKDYTLWKPAPDDIANRLGWLDAPAETLEKINSIRAAIEPLTKDNIKDVVLLGIGGSSLAAEVFSKILGSATGYPELRIADTTDPVIISQLTQSLNLEKTLFLVSSKSGTTLEITSLFKYFYNLTLKKSGNKAGSRFIFITDEGSPLIKIAEDIAAHFTFFSNSDIGGRYSALSPTGIVPAAIIGIDIEKLLQRALDASRLEKLNASGTFLGAALGMLALAGRDKLTFILPPHWKSFGDWLEQLIAESTGKEEKGILPVLNEPLAGPLVYGKDRLFIFFQNKEDKNKKTTSLVQAGHPVINIRLDDDYDLGGQMFVWEMAIAAAAHLLNINPFDQPNVEATKAHTRRTIALYREKKELPDDLPSLTTPECVIYGGPQVPSLADALKNFLSKAAKGDYVCWQVYLSPTPEVDEALQKLSEMIFAKHGLAVTTGYGPRYLHSTGQLHKGDSGNGLFIQLTQDNSLNVDIPDNIGEEKSSLSFGMLKAAQAKGDWQALINAERRIIRFHFPKNPVAGLKTLAELL